MPIYGYECKECGVRFERRQSFSDADISVCPECEGKVRRLLEPAGIIFKGSGFYVTDNRGKKSTTTSQSSSKSEGKSDNDSITKAESKTKTKASTTSTTSD